MSLSTLWYRTKAQKGFPAKQGRFLFNLLYSSNLSITEVLQCFRTQLNNGTKPAKKLKREQLEKEDKFRETTEILVFLRLLLILCPQWWTKTNLKHMFHPITSDSLTSQRWESLQKMYFPSNPSNKPRLKFLIYSQIFLYMKTQNVALLFFP